MSLITQIQQQVLQQLSENCLAANLSVQHLLTLLTQAITLDHPAAIDLSGLPFDNQTNHMTKRSYTI